MFFALIIWLFLTYVNYYGILSEIFHIFFLDDIIVKIFTENPNFIILKCTCVAFLFCSIMTYSSSKTIGKEKKVQFRLLSLGAIILFVFLGVIEFKTNTINIFYFFFHCLLYFISLYALINWRKKNTEDLKKDRRNEIESEFDQKRDKIDTEYSVNISYCYNFRGNKEISYINVVNPFRASLIGGTPGSGKSFAIIEEYLRQHISKGFTGVCYDFKYPILTRKVYNYLNWYLSKYKVKPKFYVINFDDPEYSHRCNPISADGMETIADAEENTKVLMLNINKTWIDKEGEFFTDSANLFTSVLMWYLKLVTKKYDYDVCSIPHLVALQTFESTEILFLILREYSDLKSKIKPFTDALEKGALEQLAGQIASAGVALSKIFSKELNFVLTGNDFSLDLNNPLNPKILCLGNNPNRQINYSAPLGLMLTKLTKSLNKQNCLPSMFNVDEFPTVYVKGIDNLIATGRSNKVAITLGFQSFAQIEADYGKDTANKVIRICGNRIMGHLFDEDAEIITKSIGKQKILNKSYTYSINDISEQNQVNLEDIVPASRISQFSQGTFAGVIADDFDNKESNKIFYGECQPPLGLKKHEDNLDLPKVYNFSLNNIDEIVENYISTNKKTLNILVECIAQKKINEWLEIISGTNTESELDNYFIENCDLEYSDFKNFSVLIKFKNQFFQLIRKYIDVNGENGMNSYLKRNLLNDFFKKAIYEGFNQKFKDEFLENHTNEIYNDIYRLIALEIKDLNILDEIKSQNKLKLATVSLFNRILNDLKFNDDISKKHYKEFIDYLRLV